MFKTGENYFVVGWISNNLLDIIDIYWIKWLFSLLYLFHGY
jgi:hypothetical protein